MTRGLVVALALATVGVACVPAPSRLDARRVVTDPVPTPTPLPTPAPTPAPTPRPSVAATPEPRTKPDITAFRGFGGWIDVFDTDDAAATVLPFVAELAREGVQTLYLETARSDDPSPIRFPAVVAAALEEAHRLGMDVVAWYPPSLADVDHDLAMSIGAIRYRSPRGHRFDAFASDIEYTDGVPDDTERNARLVDYSVRLRRSSGPAYALAAIVIPPTSHEINPTRWPSFPWKAISPAYDVFMPMNYWTGRDGHDPDLVRDLTTRNADASALASGRPVHVIGGVANGVDEAEARAYVEAVKASVSIGGSLYDYRTTSRALYPILRGLRR